MSTDISEAGLEATIVSQMTAEGGWIEGSPTDYDREFAIDQAQLANFLEATQPQIAEGVEIHQDGTTRRRFLARLQGEITSRGIVDVLRNGVKHGPLNIDLFYGTPSTGNPAAVERYAKNRFVVTRQLRYSSDETRLALDLGAFRQRLAGRNLRAEEQPDQADCRGCRRAVQERPRVRKS